FQAEDGIRDKLVTGVQTCALPIWEPGNSPVVRSAIVGQANRFAACRWDDVGVSVILPGTGLAIRDVGQPSTIRRPNRGRGPYREIGRASCRERGVDTGGGQIRVYT